MRRNKKGNITTILICVVIALSVMVCVALYIYQSEIKKEVHIIDRQIKNGQLVVILDGPGRCGLGTGVNNLTEWVKTDINNTCFLDIEEVKTNL